MLKVWVMPVSALCGRCLYPMGGEVPRGEHQARMTCHTSDCPEKDRVYLLPLQEMNLNEIVGDRSPPVELKPSAVSSLPAEKTASGEPVPDALVGNVAT